MPGPVSDSYDPEWGTAENARRIKDALDEVYAYISQCLGDPIPECILQLLDRDDLVEPAPTALALTEKQWRIVRFALGRASDYLT